MAQIIFMTQNQQITLEADSGSLMELAVQHGVDGIGGDCGGVCSCATCHVKVAPEHVHKVGYATEIEKDMLELDEQATALSRLCCQIDIDESLDGLVVTVVGEA